MFAHLWKTSRTPCSLAPMYLLRSSGPYREVDISWDTPKMFASIKQIAVFVVVFVLFFLKNQRAHLDTDEVHAAVFGHSSGQEGLPRAGGSVQQDAGAMADRQIGEQNGILQKSKDITNFLCFD